MTATIIALARLAILTLGVVDLVAVLVVGSRAAIAPCDPGEYGC